MIRLNDINKTVISETKIKCYSSINDYTYDNGIRVDREAINIIFTIGGIMAHYETKEARDKDIELLDKIFDVKSIEDKANEESKPSYDFGEPVECEPNPKEEEYVTWKEVKRCATWVNVKLPNEEIRSVCYDEECFSINILSNYGDTKEAIIYDEDLFNALMLKKVE